MIENEFSNCFRLVPNANLPFGITNIGVTCDNGTGNITSVCSKPKQTRSGQRDRAFSILNRSWGVGVRSYFTYGSAQFPNWVRLICGLPATVWLAIVRRWFRYTGALINILPEMDCYPSSVPNLMDWAL